MKEMDLANVLTFAFSRFYEIARNFKRYLRSPHQYSAFLDYRLTDERLKFVHILECINYVRVAGVGKIPPVYAEFGCHSGRTFSAAINASRYLKMSDTQFYAFDSFEGLPKTETSEDGYFQGGTFCTGQEQFLAIVEKKTGASKDVKTVKGFYQDSLTPDLQKSMPKLGVVHIDVDLYSSTKTVLNFIKPLLVEGTVILFDDWYTFPPGENKGEKKALVEFCQENPNFRYEDWKNYSTFGKSIIVTALP